MKTFPLPSPRITGHVVLSRHEEMLRHEGMFIRTTNYIRTARGYRPPADDRYYAHHAAFVAEDDAIWLRRQDLGVDYDPGRSWGSQIRVPTEEDARMIYAEARRHVRPSAAPLAAERIIHFETLARFARGTGLYALNHWSEALAAQIYGLRPRGAHHKWLEARAHGFFQRYGSIYPHAVTMKGGCGSNFDFALVTDSGRLVVLEVMSGWWEKAWPGKLRLAEALRDAGIIPIFLGARPPWEREGHFPRRKNIWFHDHAVAVGGEPGDEAVVPFDVTPAVRGVFYLPEPETCDAWGQPVIEHILTSA